MMRKCSVILMKAMLSAILCSVGILASTAYAADSDPTPVKPKVIDDGYGIKWVQVNTPEELMYIDLHQEEAIEQGSSVKYVEAEIMLMNDIDLSEYKKTGWFPLGGDASLNLGNLADKTEDWSGTLNYQGNSIIGVHWDNDFDYGHIIGDNKNYELNTAAGYLGFGAAILGAGGHAGQSYNAGIRHRADSFPRPTVIRRDGETWVQIKNAEELLFLDYNQSMPIESGSPIRYIDANIELMNDIDLSTHSDVAWLPIGGSGEASYSVIGFRGTFNGRGHMIKGWKIDNKTDKATGFFGGVEGKVVNLDLNGAVDGTTKSAFSGGMAASLGKSGVILNSSFHGTVNQTAGTGTACYIGGLVGYTEGTILNSYVSVNIINPRSVTWIGGLAGIMTGGTISDSYFEGDIEGYKAGGLVGYKADGTIVDSYATGTIKEHEPSFLFNFDAPLVQHERAVGQLDGTAEKISRYYFLKDNINSAYYAGWDNDNVWRPYFFFIGYPRLLQLDSMSWSALPSDILSSGTIEIGGTVYDAKGKPAPAGVKVDLSSTIGKWAGSPDASVRLTTDNEGRFTAQWTAPEVVQDTPVQFKSTLKIANQNSGNASLTTSITKSMTIKAAAEAKSNNADLSGLAMSRGDLSPAFAPGTTDYTVNVDNSVSSITVTPTVSDSNATVTVNGKAVASGSVSDAFNLNEGSNKMVASVTAQDGTTKKTYTVTVNRASAHQEPALEDAIQG